MRISVSRWLRAETSPCLLCGRCANALSNTAPMPVRHPEAIRTLNRLCAACRASIPWIGAPVCRHCGRPEFCPDCPRRPDKPLRFCRGAVRYDSKMKTLLALYKYRGSERLECLLAAMLAGAFERVRAELTGRDKQPCIFHAITSVPLAQARLEDRGFNQAERMAGLLSRWYGMPCYPLLQRVRHTEKQSLKNRGSRLSDMKGNFTVDPAVFAEVCRTGRTRVRILLVDDVYTTGSTVNECARVLKETMSSHSPAVDLEIYGALWARS